MSIPGLVSFVCTLVVSVRVATLPWPPKRVGEHRLLVPGGGGDPGPVHSPFSQFCHVTTRASHRQSTGATSATTLTPSLALPF